MKTREEIQGYIVSNGVKVSRSRSWEDAAMARDNSLLYHRTPSGYAEWFAIKGKKIWWVYLDSSDGGIWGVNGILITGYFIEYDLDIVRAIYSLAYPNQYDKK